MRELNRRGFIKTTAGAALVAPMMAGAAEAELPKITAQLPTDMVKLGQSGLTCNFLALGTGMSGYRRSSALTRMGEEKAHAVIRHAVDKGIAFMDMADLYGTHPFVKTALKAVDRSKLFYLTKIWHRPNDAWADASGGAMAEVDRFRKELNTDYLDVCLIHCLVNGEWLDSEKRVMDELSELKQKKTVRAVGVSCHNHDALKVAAESPWVDVILARINNEKMHMDGTVEEISETLIKARKNGKGVVGMKIFGQGEKIFKGEEGLKARTESARFVIKNNLVDAMTIGMLSTAEIDENLKTIETALKG